MSITSKIKQKKELSDIPDDLVQEVLDSYLRKHNIKSIPTNNKQVKIIVKEVRAQLRKYTGRFQISNKKRLLLLEQNKINQLLSTHTSTKERLDDYPKIIKTIKKFKPKSILDLGCGLNPIKLSAEFPDAKYHALDIKADELNLIALYFVKYNIDGDIHLIDVKKLKNYPKTDIALAFKLLDIIEPKKGHAQATNIMKKIKSPIIIVSFSTRTLSGKPMSNSRRLWFENLCKAQNLKFKTQKTSNEIFYVIKR